MPLRFAPPPEAMPRRSVTRPRRQKERPSPTQRLVHRQADLVPRGRPDAAQALDSARLAGKSVPRTATRARMESPATPRAARARSEEHTSELQSRRDLVCRLLLEKKKKTTRVRIIPKTHDRMLSTLTRDTI